MARRRRRAKLRLTGTPEEIAAARAAQNAPVVPRQPMAPPQVSRATAIAGLFGTPGLGRERITPGPRIPVEIGGSTPRQMTPGTFSARGPAYKAAVRRLNPEATFDTDPMETRPLDWRGRHDTTRPEVVQHYQDLYAQPGATGIEKERNLALSRAAAGQAAPAPAPELRPLRKEERAGIQRALDSARGDPAKLQKTIDSLDRTFSPESLRAVPGYTAYKTRETAGVALESDDDRRIRHLTESKLLLDQVQHLIDAGDERGAQMTLEALDLDTLNPRIRGQVEEVLKSPILSATQKLEEARKAIRFGTTGKKTPAEEEAAAGEKEAEAERKAGEKEAAAEQKEVRAAEMKVADRRESRAKDRLKEHQDTINELAKKAEDLRGQLAKGEQAKAEGSGQELPAYREEGLRKWVKANEDKIAELQKETPRLQQEYDDAASAADKLLAGQMESEEIPVGPGGEGAPGAAADYPKIKADVQAAIAAGTDPLAVMETIPGDAFTDEQVAELQAMIRGKPRTKSPAKVTPDVSGRPEGAPPLPTRAPDNEYALGTKFWNEPGWTIMQHPDGRVMWWRVGAK